MAGRVVVSHPADFTLVCRLNFSPLGPWREFGNAMCDRAVGDNANRRPPTITKHRRLQRFLILADGDRKRVRAVNDMIQIRYR